ncbi:tyrosine-type recombinase/integrase [Wielerella bovis]|uniref:tyrosine-type recombinase/integrase n=1 Tax=Wielerella bovis TaxID=2917790 RepID=UPI0020190907|nr:integrase arm-type DNA-binding domain-containing protein [Wielerella bovis]ULJ59772.1 integrase arm-type DNA-binding domain-containing protein [Wielerella bovis]ULJ67879.1 integrase arm-type DNA-binding domain-containing protein [Wielerella bovis]
MPKIVTPLTLGQVKSARPKDKIYKLSDGGGLSLWVLPSGGKSWRMTYIRPDKKTDTLVLGLYPEFSLADARQWRDEIRAKLARGIDPKAGIADFGAKYRFENRLAEWYERWKLDGGKLGDGKNEKYATQVLAALELNVLPEFRGRDVRQITTAEIVACLRKMEERGVLEYLKRVKSSLGLMFDYLVADGTIAANPVRIIGRQVFKKPRERHFDALTPNQLPLLIERLENTKGVSERARLLIYWQLLSMVRPNEAAEVPLSEIDLEQKIWEIPLTRMKTRPHIVPLSSALVQIYHEAMAMNARGVYLFEGLGGKPMNVETARINLRQKMKLPTTGHGLRTLATTYLREVHKIPKDIRDLLLSHHEESKTDRAYDRAEFLDERREVLELWGRDVMALREKYRKK